MENLQKKEIDFVEDGFSSRFRLICDTFYAGKIGDFANACGIDFSNMSNYMNEKRRPKIDIIRIIKTLPQINARWVLFGEGNMMDSVTSIQQVGGDINAPAIVGNENSLTYNETDLLREQLRQKDGIIKQQSEQITKLIELLSKK